MRTFRTARNCTGIVALVALSFGLGCSADPSSDTDSTDPETIATDGDALCGIPAQYDFDTYLAQNPGAKGVRFGFTPQPTYGVMIHDLFIQRDEIEVARIPSPFGFDIKGLALGDDRGHDPNFDPRRTRGFVVLDFINGRGWYITNASHFKVCEVLPVAPDACLTKSSNSREVVNAWEPGRDKNWVWADWLPNNYGVRLFRLRVSGRISVPADELFFGLDVAESFGCAFDQQLFVYADPTGHLRTIYEGDGFPSSGTYFHCGGGPFVLEERDEASGDPNNYLCGNPNYTWNQPYDPWQ